MAKGDSRYSEQKSDLSSVFLLCLVQFSQSTEEAVVFAVFTTHSLSPLFDQWVQACPCPRLRTDFLV